MIDELTDRIEKLDYSKCTPEQLAVLNVNLRELLKRAIEELVKRGFTKEDIRALGPAERG